MADEDTQLNVEFDAKLRLIECALINFNFREKSIATEWITKLKAANSSLDEKRLRNDFLTFLVKCSEDGVLNCDPFQDIPPPNTTLSSLGHLLPPEIRKHSLKTKTDDTRPKVEEMFEDATDKGVFLSLQPVPISGTFCFFVIKKSQ